MGFRRSRALQRATQNMDESVAVDVIGPDLGPTRGTHLQQKRPDEFQAAGTADFESSGIRLRDSGGQDRPQGVLPETAPDNAACSVGRVTAGNRCGGVRSGGGR